MIDRYYKVSSKSATRIRRSQQSKGTRPIRRLIEHVILPLPSNLSNFIAFSEDLARFLSQLIFQAPNSKIIVVARGFSRQKMVESSSADFDSESFEAHHE